MTFSRHIARDRVVIHLLREVAIELRMLCRISAIDLRFSGCSCCHATSATTSWPSEFHTWDVAIVGQVGIDAGIKHNLCVQNAGRTTDCAKIDCLAHGGKISATANCKDSHPFDPDLVAHALQELSIGTLSLLELR